MTDNDWPNDNAAANWTLFLTGLATIVFALLPWTSTATGGDRALGFETHGLITAACGAAIAVIAFQALVDLDRLTRRARNTIITLSATITAVGIVNRLTIDTPLQPRLGLTGTIAAGGIALIISIRTNPTTQEENES